MASCRGSALNLDAARYGARAWHVSRLPRSQRQMGLVRRSSETRSHDMIRGEAEESVKVKCFGCDALIEADDSDALVDAFVAHGRESHAWSYPEEAIRNYARNYADATERLTGGRERLPEVGDR